MPLDHEDTATAAEDFRDGGEASLSREFVLDVEGAIALGELGARSRTRRRPP